MNSIRAIRFLFFSFILCSSLSSKAQLTVGQSGRPATLKKNTPQSREALAHLKSSTTLLFLRAGEEEWQDELQKKLDEFWTISKIEVHPISEIASVHDRLEGTSISYMMMSARKLSMQQQFGDMMGRQLIVTLELSMKLPEDSKGRSPRLHFASIEMNLDENSINEAFALNDFKNEASPYLYLHANIYNWSPGTILNYARTIHGYIGKNEAKNHFESTANERELRKLRNQELLIMDNLTQHPALMKRDIKVESSKEFMTEYPYKYRLVSSSELSELILSQEEPFYYLVYVLGGDWKKFIAIYRSDNGQIVYSDYAELRGHFSTKDIAKIVKKIGQ